MRIRTPMVLLAGAVYLGLGSLGCSNSSFCPTCEQNAPVTGLHYPAITTSTVGAAMTPDLPQPSGGTPTSYAVVWGLLPPGLILDAATGRISGTPTTVGAWEVTIQGGNSAGTTSVQLTFVEEAAPASAASASSPTVAAAMDMAYPTPQAFPASLAIAAQNPTLNPDTLSGAAAALARIHSAVVLAGLKYAASSTFAISAGSLPPGLSLDPGTGAISGTPTTLGTYVFTVTATGSGNTASWTLTYTVTPSGGLTLDYPTPTVILTQNLAASVATPVLSNLPAGTTAAFSLSAGALPAGFGLNGDGSLSGTPTTLGCFLLAITATAGAHTSTFNFLVIVMAPPVAGSLTASTTTPGFNGAIQLTPVFSGGTATIGTTGSGSADLTTSATTSTAITTPALKASATYTLTVTNAAGTVATASVAIHPQTVGTPVISATSPVTAGSPDTLTATVTGGATNTVTWSASAGALAGNLWTAPTIPGSYTVTATSLDDPSKSRTSTLTVDAVPVVPVISLTNGAGGALTPGNTITGGQVFIATADAVTGHPTQTSGAYSWTVDGAAVTTGTSGTGGQTLSFTTPASAGPLTVKAVFSNDAATASAPGSATVNVVAAPTRPSLTLIATVTDGVAGTVASTTTTQPDPACTYTWTLTGVSGTTQTIGPLPWSQSQSITFTPALPGPVGYTLTATNAAQTQVSITGSSLIAPAPAQPAVTGPSGTVNAGTPNPYTASIQPQAGQTCQWAIYAADGTPLPQLIASGATGTTLTFNSPANNTGSNAQLTLSCVVTNQATTPVSAAAGTLVIAILPKNPPPVITLPATVYASRPGYIASVPATGVSYQWGITGGSIVGSSTGSQITFTPTAPGTVTVTCQESIAGTPVQPLQPASNSTTAIALPASATIGGTPYTDPFTGIDFVWIPAGSYTMGASAGDAGATDDERPDTPVTFSAGFWMSAEKISQAQWTTFQAGNPSFFQLNACANLTGDLNRPVETVSWNDAQGFLAAINKLQGFSAYRLPSEAEWEYAYRAGSTTPTFASVTTDNVATYGAINLTTGTQPLGTLLANGWGLYDLIGDTMEWCADTYAPNYYAQDTGSAIDGSPLMTAASPTAPYRSVRGSAWNDPFANARASARYALQQTARNNTTGFRIVLPVPGNAPAITSFTAAGSGGSYTLHWAQTGANALFIDGGAGPVSGTTGSTTVTGAPGQVFTLFARGSNGWSMATVTLPVDPQ